MLEVIGPELQALYDDRQIEVELVDMHFGTGSGLEADEDPFLLDNNLTELRECHKFSKSVYCLVSPTDNSLLLE